MSKDKRINDKLELIKRFGHNGDEYFCLGINAKNSEFHAAMGLCNLEYIQDIIKDRKKATQRYDLLLKDNYQKIKWNINSTRNYGYYPVVFKDESTLNKVLIRLNKSNICLLYTSTNT